KCQIEIDSGLIYCEKCNRWYPIIETIPQMLPDEYRNEHTEIEFLNKYKNLLEPEVTSKNLKPFHP
ncbi:MAG: Trm112 family protein, partial [Promethearchaeota archaeon]